MPDTRAIASLNRQTKADEDRKRWAIEQAGKLFGMANGPSWLINDGTSSSPQYILIDLARKIEDYVTGRTTS